MGDFRSKHRLSVSNIFGPWTDLFMGQIIYQGLKGHSFTTVGTDLFRLILFCFLEMFFMFKNIKTSPSLLFWQDIYWRSRFKENLWSVWKFGLLCTFSILFCPTFKIQKLEGNLLETKSPFNCFNPKVHPRNNQGDRARVNLITTKGAPPEECFWTNSWRKNC